MIRGEVSIHAARDEPSIHSDFLKSPSPNPSLAGEGSKKKFQIASLFFTPSP